MVHSIHIIQNSIFFVAVRDDGAQVAGSTASGRDDGKTGVRSPGGISIPRKIARNKRACCCWVVSEPFQPVSRKRDLETCVRQAPRLRVESALGKWEPALVTV